MKAYILYATYRIEQKPMVHIYGRMDNGQSFFAKIPFEPYFYIHNENVKKADALIEAKFSGTKLTDFHGKKVSKVTAKSPKDVPDLRKALEEAEITTFESDIRFTQRFMMHNDILGVIDIKGKHSRGEFVDRSYEEAEIAPAREYDVRLKMIAFDIETDKNAEKIYSFSIAGDEISEVHIVSKRKVKNAINHGTEEELLRAFIDRVQELDPDIITGWNVIDFDMAVLEKRLKAYSIPFIISRSGEPCRLRIQHDFFRDSSVGCDGRIVFDGISLLKQAFLQYQDYKLDTVAGEVLGEHKIQLEEDFWERFPEIVKKEPERVAEYNLKDSVLVIKILKKLKLIELVIKKSLITGMQLDRVKGSVASLDSLYIRRATNKGYVCPNSGFASRTQRIKGAFVMDPKPGIYDWVAVLDFKSLYPSIIRTYNIDPISHAKGGPIKAPNGETFADDEGILPEIIEILWKERDKAKKEKDDAKSYAIKIIMNSFYGVIANPSCRFYSLKMGNAITAFARETIKETAMLIENDGYEVLYGDTDSVFVDMKTTDFGASEKLGQEISAKINKHFQKKVAELGRKSFLELEFEKMFKVLMLPKVRGGESGAKKRYAGLLIKDGKEEIKVTGMEIVRRDWTELAKEMQWELLDRVFHKKEVAAYVQAMIKEMQAGKHDDKLVYRKQIRKDLDEYVKTTPPHVKAARMLPKLTSSIIEYYITDQGPVPVELMEKTKAKIDYSHYMEKQIKPIADSILALFGKNFDELESGQRNLFDY